MPQTPKRWSLKGVAFAASLTIVFAACGGATTSPSASGAAPATAAPTSAPASVAPSGAAFDGIVYPASGDAPCGVAPYSGQLKKITAIDALTVEFQLCGPAADFLAKIAFSAFGIHDQGYLETHMADGSILEQPNGTGPYKLKEWSHGNRIVLERNDAYWGDKALTPNAEMLWSEQAAQRLIQLNAGEVDGIDNPGLADIPTIQADTNLQYKPRPGLNVSFLGFNNTIKPFDNEKVRQAIAMGIDRDAIVKNFYPAGSTAADYFVPCEIPYACEGEKQYTFDPVAAKALLTEAGFPDGFKTTIQFRDAVRGYVNDPAATATEISQQLKTNLNIDATPELLESGAMTGGFAAGTLKGIAMIGWGADYPDPSNFLDYHFGSGSGKKFGTPFPDIVEALNKGVSTGDPAERTAAYKIANGLIKQHVPAFFMVHGASGAAYKADVENAYASVFGAEQLAVMKAGDRDTIVFVGNSEPNSLYCGDEEDGETLRACEQINESLYRYKIGGAESIPSLATECTPNADATTWTCKLRPGVKFQDGADLDANDVVTSYALQWDTQHPLHKGRTGTFSYFPGLWGGFLNPPPPATPAPPVASPSAS